MSDFNKWWATINQTIGEVADRAAWDHQQAEIERLNGRLRWRMCADEMPKPQESCLVEYVNGHGMTRTVRAVWVARFTQEGDSDWCEYNEEDDLYYNNEGWYEAMETEVSEDYSGWWMDCQTPVRWLPIKSLKEQGE